MVDAMQWDYRAEPNASDFAHYPILKELIRLGYVPKIIELNIQQEAPDAEAEIIVDYTVIFDGTATAKVAYYDSSDVKDTSAGVGTKTIKVLSTNEAGNDYQEITDDMVGQTGTATAEKHQRLIAVKGMTAGAEGDTAGTLTIQDDAGGTNKHMTIAAANMSSISARIYMPDGWKGLMYYIHASKPEVADATAEIILDTGFIFKPFWDDASGVDIDDVLSYTVSSSVGAVEVYNATPIIASADGAAYITLKHVTKEADLNALALYKIIYVVWDATKSIQRGIGL